MLTNCHLEHSERSPRWCWHSMRLQNRRSFDYAQDDIPSVLSLDIVILKVAIVVAPACRLSQKRR